MRQFQNFEEENIHYWTGRTDGYSQVNKEELASEQKRVWGGMLTKKSMRIFREEHRKRSGFWISERVPVSFPFFWRKRDTR